MTAQQFVDTHCIRMRVEVVTENPGMPEWKDARHYVCHFRHIGRTLKTYFSMGLELTEQPTAAEVLDCLASDAAAVENVSTFEEWCGEYGYDVDSRKAEKTFRSARKQTQRLRTFMGESDYQDLLCNVWQEDTWNDGIVIEPRYSERKETNQ